MRVAMAVAVAVMLALGPAGVSGASGQIAKHHERCDVCNSNGASEAVVFGAFDAVHRFRARFEKGEAKSTDVQAVVTGLRILFAHLDEVGVTKEMEQSILAREEELIRHVVTRAEAAAVAQHHEKLGLQGTVDQEFQLMSGATVNDRINLVKRLKNGGMKGLYASIIANFEELQVRLAKAEKVGKPLSAADFRACEDYHTVAAMFGVACALGCAGCCVVSAMAELSYVLCERTGGLF